ncbi:MAG: HEPN domain-containing protein [Bacteroidota bacterium]
MMKDAKTVLKTSLAHLPPSKQQELAIIQEIIRKHVPAQMIILFGSYARGDYVEKDYTIKDGTTYGYVSDFDILVVTKRRIDPLKQRWRAIEQTIAQKPLLTPITLINHDFFFFNAMVKHRHYFFADIIKEGIMLYDSGKYQLAVPTKLPNKKRLKKAKKYFEYWMDKGDDCKIGFDLFLDRQMYAKAAFELHQAVENYYAAFSLVMTDYKPKTHDLEALRKRSIMINEALKDIFPLDTKEKERRFTLLRKAYVEARYNATYKITEKELQYLSERTMVLQELTDQLCQEEIAKLQEEIARLQL